MDQSLDINKAEESYDESRNQHLEALVKGLVDSESSFKHRPTLEESKQQDYDENDNDDLAEDS